MKITRSFFKTLLMLKLFSNQWEDYAGYCQWCKSVKLFANEHGCSYTNKEQKNKKLAVLSTMQEWHNLVWKCIEQGYRNDR